MIAVLVALLFGVCAFNFVDVPTPLRGTWHQHVALDKKTVSNECGLEGCRRPRGHQTSGLDTGLVAVAGDHHGTGEKPTRHRLYLIPLLQKMQLEFGRRELRNQLRLVQL
jgi:hypothetical protein